MTYAILLPPVLLWLGAFGCIDAVVVNRSSVFIHEFREWPASGIIAPLAETRSAKQTECEGMEGQQYKLRGFTEL